MNRPLLEVRQLEVQFHQHRSTIRAVDGVSFAINEGEVLGLVGESGSGKSTIGRALLGLNAIHGGQVVFDGRDITSLRGHQRRELATEMQVVFQDPLSSLDPRWTIGRSLGEPMRTHRALNAPNLDHEVTRLLAIVGLPPEMAHRTPRQLSGGQRQRVAIARAVALAPRLVICDEPTSALDLSTQSQTLNLLRQLHREQHLSLLFISHDLDVVRYISDRVCVLYRGQVMESGPAVDVADRPLHPYSQMLVNSAPVPDPFAQAARREARSQVTRPTGAESGAQPAGGCPYAARCIHAADTCRTERPALLEIEGNRTIACHLFDPESGHPARRRRQDAFTQ